MDIDFFRTDMTLQKNMCENSVFRKINRYHFTKKITSERIKTMVDVRPDYG